MKKLLIICAVACVSISAATANEPKAGETSPSPPPLTINNCLTILKGLSDLDGYTVVLNAGTPQATESRPQTYTFKNATLRLDIQKNITALQVVAAQTEKARQQIFAEAAKGALTLEANTPARAEYDKQVAALGESLCSVVMTHIKASDLKLEINEIPGTALAAIDRILDK